MKEYTVLHLFSGLGGAAIGFQQAVEEYKGMVGRFRTLAGIDCDRESCEDFRALTGAPAVEMDLFARSDYEAFHGHEPPADWREAVSEDLRAYAGYENPDVVFLSPPCLPGREEVLTVSGPKRIESIQAGELILTHLGRYRRVLKVGTHNYNGDIFGIRLNGTVDFHEFTAEHPILRRRVIRPSSRKRTLSDLEFVKASDIRIGDRIGFPVDSEIKGCANNFVESFGDPQVITKGGKHIGEPYCKSLHEAKVERIVDLSSFTENKFLWFLFGAYLGDGYRRENRHEVIFCVGATNSLKAGQVRTALSELGLKWNENDSSGLNNIKIRIHSKHLCQLVGAFGDGAENKDIPTELMHLESPLVDALIDGYRVTDGSKQGRRMARNELQARWKIPSVSLPLLKSLQRLLLRREQFGAINKCWPGGEQVIEGRRVQTRPRYELVVRMEPQKRTVYEFIDGAVWVRVRDIIKHQTQEQVWNLEVEEDNTFCVSMMATHNCKGFSGLLPSKSANSEKYQALNNLVIRGLKLTVEAFSDDLPTVILFENVPRITSRGEFLLKQVKHFLGAHGYLFHEGFHDCGELGGLGQHRKRYLLIARLPEKMSSFIYKPPNRRVKSIGEVIGQIPMPDDQMAGSMHRLPRLKWKTWMRLALIPAGGDWRDLEKLAPEEYRLEHVPRKSSFGVQDWDDASGTVIGNARVGGSQACAVADPRLPQRKGRHPAVYQVVKFDEPAPCVTGTRFGSGAPAIADPRTGFKDSTHHTIYRITRWEESANTITGAMRPNNGAISVADHRMTCNPRSGTMGVQSWDEPGKTVIGAGDIHAGAAAVADPRIPAENDRPNPPPVIITLDGTWHRPLTTLELAALQGFSLTMPDGRPLTLTGKSDARWRERIGNAVPPPAACAMAEQILTALLVSEKKDGWALGTTGVWVKNAVEEAATCQNTQRP